MVIPMNVEKLKRMNVLASTLKQQGLAATSEDAAYLANSMVSGKQEEDLDKIFQQADKSVNAEEDSEEHREEEKSFGEEQIKQILQSFSDQFCTELNKLCEKQEQQAKTIAILEEQLQAYQKSEVSEEQLKDTLEPGSEVVVEKESEPQNEMPAENPEPQREMPAENPEPQRELPVEKTEPAPKEQTRQSPRSGGYNSDDVSIEKFFYYGQK